MNRIMQIMPCVLALALTAGAHATSSNVSWQSDWTLSLAPAIGNEYQPAVTARLQAPIVVTPDGEILVRAGARSELDDQIVRLDGAGNVRWRVNLGNLSSTDDWTEEAMIGRSDGGAYAAVNYGTAVVSIDALGNVVWSTATNAAALAMDGNLLLIETCNGVQALDGSSGALIWSRHVVVSGNCYGGGLAVDTDGAIYAGFVGYPQPGPASALVKLDAAGTLLWQARGVPSRIVGVAGGLVYASNSTDLGLPIATAAVRASDGSLGWQVNGADGVGMAGSTPEVIVKTNAGYQRLSAQDGTPRWSVGTNPVVPHLAFAFAYGSKVIVDNVQIDADTGSLDWTTTLANGSSPDTLQETTAGRLANGQIVFGLVPAYAPAFAPVLQTVDAGSGALGAQFAPAAAPQGLSGFSLTNGSLVINVAPYADGADFPTAVRALDASSGALQWQTTVLPQAVGQVTPTYRGGTIAGDALVLSDTENTGYYGHPSPGGVWIGAYELATGNARWTALLEQIDSTRIQDATDAYDPQADADGNVILAYSAYYTLEQAPPFSPQFQYVKSVVKLSAADGSVLWRHDESQDVNGVGTPYAPAAFVVGNDVYLAGPFAAPYDQNSVIKLSGADGSVQWASSIFANAYVVEVHAGPPGSVIVRGPGRAALDAQTGAVLWSAADSLTCTGQCTSGGGEVVLPSGDAYFATQNASRAEIILSPADANASAQEFRFDASDTKLRTSYAYTLNRAADGTLWTAIFRKYIGAQRALYLAQFDPVTHTLLRQQALDLAGNSPLFDHASAVPLAAPQNEWLPVETFGVHPPQQPATLGAASIDTHVTSTGNLSVHLATDKSVAGIGAPVNFHLHVDYSGDNPIAGARLVADFPWTGHATSQTCTTQSASNCALDTRSDSVMARFDLQPGGSIDITGQLLTSDGTDGGRLSAVVIGPVGLNEQDPSDNAAQVIVNQSLFANGFE